MDYRLLIFIIFLCSQCVLNNKNQNFTKSQDQFDMNILPLTDNYKLYSPDGGFSWYYKFNHIAYEFSDEVGSIEEIAIQDHFLILHTERIYFNSSMTKTWVFIDSDKKEEIIFTSIKDLNDSLNNEKELNFFK